jgi:hypothetical protein
MTSHDPAYAAGYLLGQFLIQIALLVAAVALLLTGVIVAIRAKQTAKKLRVAVGPFRSPFRSCSALVRNNVCKHSAVAS